MEKSYKDTALSVTQVNEYIKRLLEEDAVLSHVCIKGELSNFKVHSSGHCYFTLKDEGGVISGVMFKTSAAKLKFRPETGMKVLVFGRISLFSQSGQYQVYATGMEPDGVGSLFIAFEQLKAKLLKEGLFDKAHKKPIPRFPRRIALITSPTGAAVRDMIRIISARYKACDILVCPVTVQGETGAKSIGEMVDYVNEHRLADLIICGRGGGSMEDLWCFNEEPVAYAIFNSKIPVISAVGHEPDVTIADYVADLRAATPSNAAELAVPDSLEIILRLEEWRKKLYLTEHQRLMYYGDKLKTIGASRMLIAPEAYVNERSMQVGLLEQRLVSSIERAIENKRRKYVSATATLDAISPLKVIARGYGLVEKEGQVIKSVEDVKVGEVINVRLSDGTLSARAEGVAKDQG